MIYRVALILQKAFKSVAFEKKKKVAFGLFPFCHDSEGYLIMAAVTFMHSTGIY